MRLIVFRHRKAKRPNMLSYAGATALLGSLSVMSAATAADNVTNGKRLAQRWCASCHIVEPNQSYGRTDTPPFSEIAKRRGFDASRLAFFLLDPHPKMPDFGLSRDAASDLAAYIASQGPNGGPTSPPTERMPRRTGAIDNRMFWAQLLHPYLGGKHE